MGAVDNIMAARICIGILRYFAACGSVLRNYPYRFASVALER